MRACNADLRERIVQAAQDGKPHPDVAALYRVSLSSATCVRCVRDAA